MSFQFNTQTRRQRAQLASLAAATLAATITVLVGCAPNTSPVSDANPVNTGTLESEGEYGVLAPSQSRAGATLYVASDQLRLRKSPSNDATIAATIYMNEQVKVVNSHRIGDDEFLAVKVIKGNEDLKGKTVYASAKYLSASPSGHRLSPSTGASEGSSDRFVITNVATEMIRLYRRCHAPEACHNKMLMQFHGTVGNNSDGRRSDVGVYKTTRWVKFYEVPGEYPAWYRPGYPQLPPVGSRGGWLSSKSKPPGTWTGARGAFGWYTVFVGPNNDQQWMHGTTGWGADKEKLVRFQDSFGGAIAGIFAKLGSHGCTRLSNEAIAYMRSNLPVGATYIKIYARERVKDPYLTGYPRELGHFPYIITTLGAGKPNTLHDLASRDSVLAAGTPPSQWLEQGTFDYEQTPQAMGGDHYKIGAFYGSYNVDDGTLTPDYRHPVSGRLHVGGYPGRESALPAFVRDNAVAPQAAPLASN